MKSDANRELNGIKFKKSKVTRNINQCLILLEVCKGEAHIKSPLLKQSAEDTMTHYNRAQSSLKELEECMEKYLTLTSHTHQNDDNDDDDEENQDSLQQLIDGSLAAIDEYSTRFYSIKGSNTEIFRVINTMLNPVQRTCQAFSSSTPIRDPTS